MNYAQKGLKYYRDLKNVTDTTREEGKIEGQRVKQQEIIIKLHRKGYTI